jgi:tetratricopeptide (TPR) repeat protein
LKPPHTNPHPEPRGWRRHLAGRELLLLVLVIGLAIYAPSLGYQFVHDDVSQIVANPRIQSWQYLPDYFTSHVWAHLYGEGQANYYRPLFLLWLLLNHTLFSLNPPGWHLTTVAAHLLAGSLVYALARELLEDTRAAALAALVFLLHPAQVESVAWVSGVSEPLTAILMLGGVLAFLKYQRGIPGSRPRLCLALALLAYFAALLMKETAVILPLLVFLCVVSFEPGSSLGLVRRATRAVRSCVPFALPLALYLLLRMWALPAPLQARMKVPVGTALLTLPSLLWLYLKHLFFPVNLALNYDTPYVTHPGLGNFVLPLAGVLLAAFAFGWAGRRSTRIGFCALWMIVPLALPLASASLFPFFDLAHDRYLYLPVAGLGLLLGEGYRRLRLWRPGALPAVAVAALAVLLAWPTLSYERAWSSNLTLHRRSVELSPGAMLPKVLLASAVEDQGEALRLLQDAEKVSGGHWLTQYALGVWCYRNGRYPEAEQYLERSIASDPELPLHYYQLGEVRLAMHQPQRAVAPLRRAVELVPDNLNYRLRYATALELTGDLEGALSELRYVLARLPREQILRGQVARLESAAARSRGRSSSPR